eukprot:3890442-Karenia_brevis.AAC.1
MRPCLNCVLEFVPPSFINFAPTFDDVNIYLPMHNTESRMRAIRAIYIIVPRDRSFGAQQE